jgi:hypothetical protein
MWATSAKHCVMLVTVALGGCVTDQDLLVSHLPDGVLEEFRVAADGDALLVPVSFGRERHKFLLDTGAEATFCDVSLKANLEDARKPGGQGLCLGKLRIGALPSIQAMDLGRFREVSGHEIEGILGMDALRRFVVQVDFDAGKVRFLRKVMPDSCVPVQLANKPEQAPCVVAQVAGLAKERFILDSGMVGYGTGALKGDLFESLTRDAKLHPLKMSLDESAAGKSAQRNGRVEFLSFGEFNHSDLIFAKQSENLLGINYLARYIVTFDFPSQTVYFKKGNRVNAADQQDRSGLHIVRAGSRSVVDSVDSGSPADSARIRSGDEILRVSDQDVEKLRLFSIRRLLCHAGSEVRIVVRRGGREIASSIVLSR